MSNNNIPSNVLEQLRRMQPGATGVTADINALPNALHDGLAKAKQDDFGYAPHYTGAALIISRVNGNWKPATDVSTLLDPSKFIIVRSARDIPEGFAERDAMIQALEQLGADVSSTPAHVGKILRTVEQLEHQSRLNALEEDYAGQLKDARARAQERRMAADSISDALDAIGY